MKLFKLTIKFIRYKIFSKNKHGHEIHSPFVYDLITQVFNDRREYEEYAVIENIRKSNKNSNEIILIDESGAESNYFSTQSRKVKDIVRVSAVNRKFGQLLFRMAKYYRPDSIIELGTSLGISTLYLAAGIPEGKVITIESNTNLAERAKINFNAAGVDNIVQMTGLFKDILPEIIKSPQGDFLAFIDGHHNEEATFAYFKILLQNATENSIFVFDDINWSDGMRNAWEKIKSDKQVTLSIDLFFMGIIFFKKGIVKQNFIINI
jgi:predicted O-methyltransferase YrrM